MPRGGIEPPTRGFSVLGMGNHADSHLIFLSPKPFNNLRYLHPGPSCEFLPKPANPVP